MDFLNKKYSEEEIRKVVNKLNNYDWYYISCYQTLSEKFIREFQDKISWYYISCYQTLSEDFIREFQDKLNWEYIRYNINLQVSDKFCEEFDEKLCLYNIWIINGKFHRTLGPAKNNEFWYRGQKAEKVSNMKEYQHWLKLRIFS
jgi:hypothetical protein